MADNIFLYSYIEPFKDSKQWINQNFTFKNSFKVDQNTNHHPKWPKNKEPSYFFAWIVRSWRGNG